MKKKIYTLSVLLAAVLPAGAQSIKSDINTVLNDIALPVFLGVMVMALAVGIGMLSQKGWDCTVTLCHSRTKNLKEVVSQADIIIAALGQAEFVIADMVKEGAVIIDVGITRVKSDKTKSGWKLLGDVKFDEVAPKCSYITPVPGGVGPMTIISLMKNTLKAARKEVYKD